MMNSDDGLSLNALIHELQAQNPSPILLYKSKGTPASDVADFGQLLEDDDFALVLQTDWQRRMLEEYGKKGVFADSTHKVTKYGHLLYSLHVRDDSLKGVAVGHMLKGKGAPGRAGKGKGKGARQGQGQGSTARARARERQGQGSTAREPGAKF